MERFHRLTVLFVFPGMVVSAWGITGPRSPGSNMGQFNTPVTVSSGFGGIGGNINQFRSSAGSSPYRNPLQATFGGGFGSGGGLNRGSGPQWSSGLSLPTLPGGRSAGMSPTGGSYPGGQPLQNPSGYARTSAYGLTSSGINLPASSTSNPLFPQGLLPFPSIGNEGIILLPQTPMEACNAYLQECQAYNQEAFKPYVEAHLQRPTLNATPVQPAPTGRPEQVSMFTTSPDELDPLGSTTVKGSLYAAQQIARARDAVRKGQFDEALDCYQAAKTIDARNTSALVGIPYCYIMTAKFQAGGLAVLRLADQRPEFWQKPPEFNAVFGAPEATIIANLPNMETRLENLIKLYGVGSGKAVSEEVKLVFLSRMFVAWLRGDLDRMKESLREAVRYAPLDASVQELYAQVTGQKAKERITLKTIPSME